MESPAPTQLTLDVGGRDPDVASLKLTGGIALSGELMMGHDVRVNIIDADGQLIATADGYVAGVGFKHHPATQSAPEYTERLHTVKLEA